MGDRVLGGNRVTRRDFLKVAGLGAAGLALATPLGRAATALAETTSTTREQKAKLTKAEFTGFSDVPITHPYYEAINGMAQEGIISGFNDGTFGPDKLITRQQFAKIIVGAIDLPVSEQDICPFDDVMNGGPNDFYPDNYVAVVAKNGITLGKSPGKFVPYDNITRAQVDTMMIRAAQNLQAGRLATPPESYQSILGNFSPDHAGFWRTADYNGLLMNLVGYGPGYDPFKTATRGEVAQMLWNLRTFERQQKTGADLINIQQYDQQNIPDFLKGTLPSNTFEVLKINAAHPVNASWEINFYLAHASNETSFSYETPDGSGNYVNKKLATAMVLDTFKMTLFFNYSSEGGVGFDKLVEFTLLQKRLDETLAQWEARGLALMTEIMQNHATNGVIRINEIKDVLKAETSALSIFDPNNPDANGIVYDRSQGQGPAIDKAIDSL